MDVFVTIHLNWGMMFLIQTTAGILGNTFLFHQYNFPFFTTQVMRPRNLILNQLIVTNNLVLLSKGIPQTLTTLGLAPYLGDAGCKSILYLYRVARGVSLITTSLLSGFQAIKLHPNTSGWLSLRISSSEWIGTCCFLCWMLQLIVNIHVPNIVSATQNSKNLTSKGLHRYCSTAGPESFIFFVAGVILPLNDIMCLFFMAWASGSMILVLHKHKQRVQYIHSHNLSSKSAREDRATRTILLLVTMFLSFYSLSSILSLCITQTENPSHWLLNTCILMSLGFPTLSPFVFICTYSHTSRCCFISNIKERQNPPTVLAF
ncbi:vomeronasal type-1 receptor 1 [Rattus norvegicus]|uniref:vomeronasal type-1 receptor 1 n=1 Tax=Rattus norvegicus TaxID=10116 RepID=UPI00001C6EF2|nr:vomeronasal type-1 receptor 1 [Rattus norvegicus]|eukprot:NP_001008933.1 vomeronasal 1 receptor 51 [Rattus norvegicus]